MEKSNDAIINTDVLEKISEWSKSGMKTAIATVIDTWGSSPRPAGSQLGVNERCEMIGSVSGGCTHAPSGIVFFTLRCPHVQQ